MKQTDKIKEFIKNMPGALMKKLLIGAGCLVIFAVVLALVLNSGNKPGFTTLFSGLNDQEAQEVMAKLQESGVDYQYQPGSILVPSEMADRTRATLAVQGYPKSGFTYETFLNNTNMMSTEADKKSLKTWEMQDRLAATIRLFDGVSGAVVQIAPGENQKYVLDNSDPNVPTASVLVEMADGGSPTKEQVMGIQRLVAKSVANMDMGDVAVIDGNGIDVSVERNDGSSTISSDKLDLEQKAQLQIEAGVLNVLEPIYGRNNVRVSVRCTADMQKVVSEQKGYTAPNVEENAGYITHQELYNSTDGAAGVGGIPGAQANTNLPQYNTQPNDMQNNSSSSSSTDYVLNEEKVQTQNDGGAITDVSVAVSINGVDLKADRNELIAMVGSAAGIDPAVQANKITIVNTAWTVLEKPIEQTGGEASTLMKLLPFLIAAGVALLILLVVLILVGRSRAKKRAEAAALAAAEEAALAQREAEMLPGEAEGEPGGEGEISEEISEAPETEEEAQTRIIKENIRDFVKENPDISAQLLRSWLRGGGEDNE